jgi:ABC-2 type transport system ATP-binding protein
MTASAAPVATVQGLSKAFALKSGRLQALQSVDLKARAGEVTALAGSDGAGKTTLIRVLAGLLAPDAGTVSVLGYDVARETQAIQSRIGYMPQRFGLYEDLTVQENLDLYADLHGVSAQARAERYPQLMEMTALAPFMRRLAGQLSGGMKQKLGLACTLVSTPELLLLDEPTAGVDPLSRRELWQIIHSLVADGLSVIVATSYLDEADRADAAVILHKGEVLVRGAPTEVAARVKGRVFRLTPPADQKPRLLQDAILADPGAVDAVPEAGAVRVVVREGEAGAALAADLQARGSVTVDPHFEDAFMAAVKADASSLAAKAPKLTGLRRETGGGPAVQVTDVMRKFGAFTAVDHVSFEVMPGEIFGLLGPNGAGKTTTFRMLCGLLPMTSGQLRVDGADMRTARAEARARLGYVAQKFSLYGILSVEENLDFFASAYGLRGTEKRERIDWALTQFELAPFAHAPSAELAGGFKQRLSMAAALLHGPDILFLDEPTSGADPLARREFWNRITSFAAQGVTVIITTHFMAEAEYCDRIAILDSGRILAQGAPADIRALGRSDKVSEPTMEDAFIAIVEAGRAGNGQGRAA